MGVQFRGKRPGMAPGSISNENGCPVESSISERDLDEYRTESHAPNILTGILFLHEILSFVRAR